MTIEQEPAQVWRGPRLDETEHGVHEHFRDVSEKSRYDPSDVGAGRAFVQAYVEYIHYVEGIYQASTSAAHGHFPEEAPHER